MKYVSCVLAQVDGRRQVGLHDPGQRVQCVVRFGRILIADRNGVVAMFAESDAAAAEGQIICSVLCVVAGFANLARVANRRATDR